ncbi:MAG: DUF6768 family protein [Phycisphaerales bacterium]
MNTPNIQKMMDDLYDDSREGTIRSMMGEFYSRRMRSTAVLIWMVGMAFLIGAILCAVAFFRADQIRDQILYATGFLAFVNLLGLVKAFAWQMVHRNSLAREIKRLEIRIAELAKSLDK